MKDGGIQMGAMRDHRETSFSRSGISDDDRTHSQSFYQGKVEFLEIWS